MFLGPKEKIHIVIEKGDQNHLLVLVRIWPSVVGVDKLIPFSNPSSLATSSALSPSSELFAVRGSQHSCRTNVNVPVQTSISCHYPSMITPVEA